MLAIKRIYDSPASDDGLRVLVDRLWPRGVSKKDAALDLWLKDVAPTPDLRTWFGHTPERFEEFSASYRAELEENPAVEQLLDAVKEADAVTLLYGARDPEHNHAVVLRDFVEDARSA